VVQPAGAFGEREGRAAFHHLCESVEQSPSGFAAGFKLRVSRRFPFSNHVEDLMGCNYPILERPDEEIIGLRIVQFRGLIERELAFLPLPTGMQRGHCICYEPREVAQDINGVTAGNHNLTGKGQVVADKDTGTHYEPGRESLIVTVPQTDNPAEIAGCYFAGSVDGSVATLELKAKFGDSVRKIRPPRR
jgi:hypothetical protein